MDLSTNYLGMNLRTPLVASASPLSRNVDDVRRLEEAGAAAVVFHSVFEEQLQSSRKAADFRGGPRTLSQPHRLSKRECEHPGHW
jgi:dihydroorotate dehydrogenase (fumarate)